MTICLSLKKGQRTNVSHTWWLTLRGRRTTPGGATLKVSLEGQPSQVSSLGTSSRCQPPGVATPPVPIVQGLPRSPSGELGHGFLKLIGLGELCKQRGNVGVEEACVLQDERAEGEVLCTTPASASSTSSLTYCLQLSPHRTPLLASFSSPDSLCPM